MSTLLASVDENGHVPVLGCLHQLLVGQCLSQQQPQNRIAEQEGVLSVVEPEGHLVKVGGQMLDAELVVGADDRALEERPDALYRVGMHIGPYPLASRVVDRLMGGVVV